METLVAFARARLHGRRVRLGQRARFGAHVRCAVGENAEIVIGDRVEIGSGTSLAAGPGARIVLDDGVFIAAGCIVAAEGLIRIGRDTMLGEFVSVRDHDHDPAYPPKSGRTLQSDVLIGERVWIGAKASVVRGATIEDDAVIGAHSLVNRTVPARSLAVGVPAVIKRTEIKDRSAGYGR